MEESPQIKKKRLEELYDRHQKIYYGMIFDSKNGTVPTSVKNVLLRMGW